MDKAEFNFRLRSVLNIKSIMELKGGSLSMIFARPSEGLVFIRPEAPTEIKLQMS